MSIDLSKLPPVPWTAVHDEGLHGQTHSSVMDANGKPVAYIAPSGNTGKAVAEFIVELQGRLDAINDRGQAAVGMPLEQAEEEAKVIQEEFLKMEKHCKDVQAGKDNK